MIREASHADIPRLVEMGAAFFALTGWSKLAEFDGASFSQVVAGLIDNRMGVVLIGDTGMAAAIVFPLLVNRDVLVGQELFWWVEPEARGHGLAYHKALEERAAAIGARAMLAIATVGMRDDTVSALYERRGYVALERYFVKELPCR